MAYQKVTTTSYGQRVKKGISGVGTGFVMFIAATILLFWNEGRTAKTASMLKRAEKACVELGDVNQVNPDMNGQLIHATGETATDDILTDDVFGISINAIRLTRSVEYYQWTERTETETRDKIGGGQETTTTYYYEKKWVSSPVNSNNFEYSTSESGEPMNNFTLFSFEGESKLAQNVSFGAYTLPEGLISQIGGSQTLKPELSDQVVAALENQARSVKKGGRDVSYVHVNNSTVYLGESENAPQVGDMKVTFSYILPHTVSILAKVNGSTFEKHTDAKNGKTLLTLSDGTISMEEMFATEKANNKALAWLLRVLGIILLYLGLKGIFDIVTTLLKVLPFLSNIASLGTGLVAGVLALVWGFLIIAIAWLWYRPVVGIIMLILAGALIWFLGKKSKEKAAAKAAEAAAAPAPAPAPAAPEKPAE